MPSTSIVKACRFLIATLYDSGVFFFFSSATNSARFFKNKCNKREAFITSSSESILPTIGIGICLAVSCAHTSPGLVATVTFPTGRPTVLFNPSLDEPIYKGTLLYSFLPLSFPLFCSGSLFSISSPIDFSLIGYKNISWVSLASLIISFLQDSCAALMSSFSESSKS